METLRIAALHSSHFAMALWNFACVYEARKLTQRAVSTNPFLKSGLWQASATNRAFAVTRPFASLHGRAYLEAIAGFVGTPRLTRPSPPERRPRIPGPHRRGFRLQGLYYSDQPSRQKQTYPRYLKGGPNDAPQVSPNNESHH